jgi:hypothetical protein
MLVFVLATPGLDAFSADTTPRPLADSGPPSQPGPLRFTPQTEPIDSRVRRLLKCLPVSVGDRTVAGVVDPH